LNISPKEIQDKAIKKVKKHICLGKWKRGRPRETWRRTVERELEKEGLRTWAAAASAGEDRTAWRQRTYGPILHLENG